MARQRRAWSASSASSPSPPFSVVIVLAVPLVLVVLALGSSVAVAVPCWQPPVEAPIADPFRPPACRWCAGNRGIEYRTRPGTPVRAVAAGRVSFAGSVAGERYVVVRHSDGRRATYGNLASIAVGEGDAVVARSIVGIASSATHFGLRRGETYLDPTPYLGRPVTVTRLIPLDGSPAAPPGPTRWRCTAPEIPSGRGANRSGPR
jgi:murein DD-endopeptidase MepM/ murein hydrolase activator NlpD